MVLFVSYDVEEVGEVLCAEAGGGEVGFRELFDA